MKIECIIDDETKDVVAKLTEQKNKQISRYNENNEEKKERVTLADMCGELITTGAFRRKAANKWAHENKKPAKPRAKRTPKAKKAKAPKKAKKAKKSAPAAAAPAAPSPLD
jgi:hypothetical protein